MKKFLAIYTCAENSQNHQAWKQLDPQSQSERMKKGILAREQWGTKYKKQIFFEGGSLGSITKKVDVKGVQDFLSQMGAFVIILADSHDEAAKMFLEHPHFTIFPGDGVNIIEVCETMNFKIS